MLLRRRVPVVIEVMQQPCTPVQLRKSRSLFIMQPQPRRLAHPITFRATRYRQPMLYQRLIGGPLSQQHLRPLHPKLCAHKHLRSLLPLSFATVYHFGSTATFYHIFGRISGITLDSFGTQCHSRHIACLRYRTQAYGARSGSRPQ